MRALLVCLAFVIQLTLFSFGQEEVPGDKASVSCTFADDKQITVRYNQPPAKGGQDFHSGKIWEIGGSPMLLFTQTAIMAGDTEIPPGAFSLYVIPEKRKWTLVVNRNVTAGSAYDEKQDLTRVPMELGEIATATKDPEIALGRMGPKQCNMRVYYEKTGAWAEFREK